MQNRIFGSIEPSQPGGGFFVFRSPNPPFRLAGGGAEAARALRLIRSTPDSIPFMKVSLNPIRSKTSRDRRPQGVNQRANGLAQPQ